MRDPATYRSSRKEAARRLRTRHKQALRERTTQHPLERPAAYMARLEKRALPPEPGNTEENAP